MKLGNDVFLFYEVAKFILKFAIMKELLGELLNEKVGCVNFQRLVVFGWVFK